MRMLVEEGCKAVGAALVAAYLAEFSKPLTFLVFGLFLGSLLTRLIGAAWRKRAAKATPPIHPVLLNFLQSSGKENPHTDPDVMALLKAFNLKAADRLGVTACVPTPEGTDLSPERCRQRTQRCLRFSGVQGRKWIDRQENSYELFERFLRRLKNETPDPSVRFLLVDPTGPRYAEIAQKYGIQIDPSKEKRRLELFRDLHNKYSFFDVRFFDHDPYFRIVVVDEREMAVAPYRPKEQDGASAPHLVFENDPDHEAADAWSLFTPFLKHFEDVWGESAPLGTAYAKMTAPSTQNSGKRRGRRVGR